MRFSSFTYLVGQGLHNLKANKMMTLASMGVLIVCMILVGAAFLFGANIDSMVAYIGEQNETVAFINDDADTAAVEEAIRSIPHVAGVEFISKDQMLDKYSQRLEGYTNLKEMFQNDNPLLANYVVRADEPANISSVDAALQNVDGVRAVNSPQAMSDLFVSLQKAVTYVCYGLVIVLAIVSVVVISNTIKINRVQPPQGDWHYEAGWCNQRLYPVPVLCGRCYLRPDLRADRFRHCVRRILCRV